MENKFYGRFKKEYNKYFPLTLIHSLFAKKKKNMQKPIRIDMKQK